ncbi:MAG: DUF4350 domain-containing protein [Gammaproteobacteria bacterium]|jgi:hypothetical protein
MNDRLGSIGWMAGLLALLALIFWPKGDVEVPTRPLSSDTRAAGLAAFERWLHGSQIETARLGQRYTGIAALNAASRGNLLVVHVPMLLVPEAPEIAALHAWVATGNTLVLSASLLESPAWHLTGASVIETTELLGRLSLSVGATEDIVDNTERARSFLDVPAWVALSGSAKTAALRAVRDHPLGRGFEDVRVPWDGTIVSCCATGNTAANNGAPETPDGSTDTSGAWRTLVEHADSGQAAAWEKRFGDGNIIVLGHPSLLANAAIPEHNNRRFAMNLIAERLGPDGRVIFDDAHQGDNDLYTPRELLSDIRLLYTLGFLLVCWAVYLLADAGTWERVTTARAPRRPGHADRVRASGGYLARRLQHRALADGLLAPLGERLARKWRLPAERALADGLELERVEPAVADELMRGLGGRTARGLDPVRLHNLILQLRREAR